MPIRPEKKHLYPADWKEISQRVRQRARNQCEFCGVHNHAWGYRDKDGKFHRVPKRPIIDMFKKGHRVRLPVYLTTAGNGTIKIIEIVLTVAHLDHQPSNCADENLKALCQKCHLAYDKHHHAQTRAMTKAQSLALVQRELL